jgi:hypothetical protein
MDKVQPIGGNEVVDVLTKLRERALRGEVTELAFVALGSADHIGHVGTSSDPVRVLGLLARLSIDVSDAVEVVEP